MVTFVEARKRPISQRSPSSASTMAWPSRIRWPVLHTLKVPTQFSTQERGSNFIINLIQVGRHWFSHFLYSALDGKKKKTARVGVSKCDRDPSVQWRLVRKVYTIAQAVVRLICLNFLHAVGLNYRELLVSYII